MSRKIFNVVVNKISLLTTEKEPAVEKAWIDYAIFKSVKLNDSKTNENTEIIIKDNELNTRLDLLKNKFQ